MPLINIFISLCSNIVHHQDTNEKKAFYFFLPLVQIGNRDKQFFQQHSTKKYLWRLAREAEVRCLTAQVLAWHY